MLEHLIDLLDDNPFTASVSDPTLPAVAAHLPVLPNFEPPTPMQAMRQKLDMYNVEMPFSARDKRRIIENMTFNEALMAVKSSDRLSALNMLGKMESVNIFAAEKKVVEISDTSELKSRILQRLGIDPNTIEDAVVLSETPAA